LFGTLKNIDLEMAKLSSKKNHRKVRVNEEKSLQDWLQAYVKQTICLLYFYTKNKRNGFFPYIKLI